MQEKRHRIHPTTHEHSIDLRRNATKPEQVLWSVLRSKQLSGLKFRKQHPIKTYIVDFYCAEKKLVVEVDGRSHEGRASGDLERQTAIEGLGYRVLRVSNDDVLENLEGVCELIARVACDGDPHPPLAPP